MMRSLTSLPTIRNLSRRTFLATGVAAAASHAIPSHAFSDDTSSLLQSLPFHLAVINDEIAPDFEHACHVASVDLGLGYIELRGLWGKNITNLTDAEITEARRILAKYNLTVTDIASPLFKVNQPDPNSSSKLSKRTEFGADFSYEQQPEVLERCIHLALSFNTDRIRCFDFTRLADPKPMLPEIHETLRKAADTVAKHKLILLLENEHTCNTATGAEAAATLAAVRNTNFMLNWDPGNAAAAGDTPYPNGYYLIPKNRIGHVHCKDVVRLPNGKTDWAPVGAGIIDWRGQFKALLRQKYNHTVSLETHWRGAGSAEASTLVSMAGLKKVLYEAIG
jgi:L-ribulose-5-phosphate 3-epimerase